MSVVNKNSCYSTYGSHRVKHIAAFSLSLSLSLFLNKTFQISYQIFKFLIFKMKQKVGVLDVNYTLTKQNCRYPKNTKMCSNIKKKIKYLETINKNDCFY